MIRIIAALWLAIFGSNAEVKNLSVMPSANRTEVVVRVDGEVTVKHMLLREGNRLVLDLSGVQQAVRLDFSDINRGGVQSMYLAQFQPNVVRVVVVLTQAAQYDVKSAPGEVRVSFPNPTGAFEPWTMGLGAETKAAAPKAEVKSPPPTAAQVQQVQRENIDVTYVDEPINNVLAEFSKFSGRSIIPAPEVGNIVINATVTNKPWDVALNAILDAHGLAIHENEDGILIVEMKSAVEARVAQEPTVTVMIPIRYIGADTLMPAVQSLLTPTIGAVAVNVAGNSLIITDLRSAIARITPIVTQMDIKPAQVSISAKIVFVDRTALEDLGFVYDLKDSRGNQLNRLVPGFLDANNNGIFEADERTENNVILLGGNSVAALANANFRVANPALQILSSLVMGRHSLFMFLDALQTVSVSDVVATPVVTTMDNRLARIQVGERTPIRTIDAGATTTGGPGSAPTASVRTEETGIILEVTPRIVGNQVTLEIHAERSNIALAPGDIGATFNTQEADTQVLVENGETAVIGGLTLIEKLKVRSGIPFLMDLPVLGALFRQESERENKRDLLIMVTPHIIRDR